MGIFSNFLQQKRQPVQTQPVQSQPQQATTPKVDNSNAIGSLAQLLGPTPAEREAQQAQLARNRQKMATWTALADGLRQLGNLYYTANGARPQRFTDPYKQIEENYQRSVRDMDDAASYRQKYAMQLYNLQRQAKEDERKDVLAKAQAKWYGTRDEAARQKTELDKLKAVKVFKMQDGSLMKYDPVSGEAVKISDSDPWYIDWKKSQTYRNYHPGTGGGRGGANNGTYGYETLVTQGIDKNGFPWKKTKRTPTTNGQPKGQEKPTETVKKSAKSGQNGTKQAKPGQSGTKQTGKSAKSKVSIR